MSESFETSKPEPGQGAEPKLEFPVAPDFDSLPPRLSPDEAIRFLEETFPYFQHSELDRETRADKSPEEFILD